jgi:hypothetical protein
MLCLLTVFYFHRFRSLPSVRHCLRQSLAAGHKKSPAEAGPFLLAGKNKNY